MRALKYWNRVVVSVATSPSIYFGSRWLDQVWGEISPLLLVYHRFRLFCLCDFFRPVVAFVYHCKSYPRIHVSVEAH